MVLRARARLPVVGVARQEHGDPVRRLGRDDLDPGEVRAPPSRPGNAVREPVVVHVVGVRAHAFLVGVVVCGAGGPVEPGGPGAGHLIHGQVRVADGHFDPGEVALALTGAEGQALGVVVVDALGTQPVGRLRHGEDPDRLRAGHVTAGYVVHAPRRAGVLRMGRRGQRDNCCNTQDRSHHRSLLSSPTSPRNGLLWTRGSAAKAATHYPVTQIISRNRTSLRKSAVGSGRSRTYTGHSP